MLGLLLLLIFQTVFLDDLYEFSKIRTVKNAANEMVAALSDEDLAEYAEYWSVREECSVVVIDAQGTVLYSFGTGVDALRANQGDFRAYYDTALKQDGEIHQKLEFRSNPNDTALKPPMDNKPDESKKPPEKNRLEIGPSFGSETVKCVLYGLMEDSGNTPRLVLVSSVLTPVDATVRVLQMQFVIASVVFVVLSVILAWFMAKKIASPIVHINYAAKGLASGTYQPPQEGSYREVAELRETLTTIDGELRKSEQLQRDLIANVSHDLRTPLTMIIGYGEAIRDLPGEDSAENIQVVIDEAGRLSQLVNDVLDLSKLQSGVEQFDMALTGLTELLRDTVARLNAMVQPNGFFIVLQAEEDVFVLADEVRLTQIVYNLLLNALAHTGDDQCVTVRQTAAQGRVRVSFTDSGNGIPEEELANIWLRYYQVHSHERRHTMNSGLGLSIVHALVQHHGGTCGVESTLGKGSTFWFELPLL